jgi:putative drug exporter of the RND superfamily
LIGEFVTKYRWPILIAWLLAVALAIGLKPDANAARKEPTSFLPADTPTRTAVSELTKHFGHTVGLSEAVIVFNRSDGELTGEDDAAISKFARRVTKPSEELLGPEDLDGVSFRSPDSMPVPRQSNPYIAAPNGTGQAALVKINIPANFITSRSARIVKHVRAILDEEELDFPEGLSASVTGSSAFGLDYARAAEQSHVNTFAVTISAIVLILLIIYRAPLAAIVPLGAISAAAIIALTLLKLGNIYLGMSTGLAETIFTIVLLYGAGTDYTLLLMSRQREFLRSGLSHRQATSEALNHTLSALLASAGTDTAGLMMLTFADYDLFSSAGPAIAVALVVALAAVITLVPAVVVIVGPKIYWPAHPGRADQKLATAKSVVWQKVASVVTARPGTVLAAGLVLLAIPAWQGAKLNWVYDTLADLDADYEAAKGACLVQEHWPIGEIAPVNVLIEAPGPIEEKRWMQLSADMTATVSNINASSTKAVHDIRSLSKPLGRNIDTATEAFLKMALAGNPPDEPRSQPKPFGLFNVFQNGAKSLVSGVMQGKLADIKKRTFAEYVSKDRTAMRIEIILDKPAMTLQAMSIVKNIREELTKTLAQAKFPGKVHIAGATAQTMDIRSVTGADFYRIATLALGVIFLIVWLLLKDVILSGFMVLSTLISYWTTLGVTYWVFVYIFGASGLDWKVEIFLFVIMMAVGQDYNIFLAARVSQEARRMKPRRACRHAIIHTGPVISSCGLIMAATLGSLMVGDMALLKQLGFAMALGMLIDSFVIRPLILPAFISLTGRTGQEGSLHS